MVMHVICTVFVQLRQHNSVLDLLFQKRERKKEGIAYSSGFLKYKEGIAYSSGVLKYTIVLFRGMFRHEDIVCKS